jgi:hypothetical protein
MACCINIWRDWATLLLRILFVGVRTRVSPAKFIAFLSPNGAKIDGGLGQPGQPILLHAVPPSAEALTDQSLDNNSPSLIVVLRTPFVMAKTHSRSPTPEPRTAGLKRPKIGHHHPSSSSPPPPTTSPALTPTGGHDGEGASASGEDAAIACFAPDLLDADNVDRLATSYASSEPFKHALVDKLFRDDFLQKVKDECLSELHFTEKETDIYKVHAHRISPPLS